ncbi:MAG: hypothetical protein A3E88_05300 [Legionellales bacterium RIFCSPHIGHO2_12_FULL_35_11]|nr:MAG: hypothetical protein A3E88_05300 [Legionellales bacterium RIFCSPHIGHO2_12_FULL_35_11]
MELRQHFTKKIWWGKIIGAFFGFLIAGPIGALFGLLIGNFFDRGLVEHFSKPFWHYYNEKDINTKEVFFQSLFLLLGHIAKTDGRVSETDIKYAKEVMERMGLRSENKKLAQNYFNEGKSKNFNIYDTLNELQKAIGKKPNLIRLFIETQFQYIRKTGPNFAKIDILNNILSSMRLAPLHQQGNFGDGFSWYETRQQKQQRYDNSQSSQNSSRRQTYNSWQSSSYIDDCYKILGVNPEASQAEVKRAYRKKISLNHPDKLIAKKASEAEIKTANLKTTQIRKAYEDIKIRKGW